MCKKLLSMALTLVVLLAIIPLSTITARANDPDWTGYTAISTKAQLNAVRNNLSGNYYLKNDIVFTPADFESGGAFYNDGEGWVPIGKYFMTDKLNNFSGIFDGNGHVIKGLYVNTPHFNAGLFGSSSGIIKNLGMVGGEIKATTLEAYVGGIVGYMTAGSITNCYNTSAISAISNSANAIAGGIVGSFRGYPSSIEISNCYNTGNITVIAPTIDIMAHGFAGGILGEISASNISRITINNCYNTGMISATAESKYGFTSTGGIVGISSSGSTITISNCYYLDNIAKGIGNNYEVADTAVKCTLEQMKQQSTFTGFDFGTIWIFDVESDYPFPQLCNNPHNIVEISLGDPTGDGEINVFDIMAIRNYIFGTEKLTGATLAAADVNGDGEINIFDIMAIRDHIFGKALLF